MAGAICISIEVERLPDSRRQPRLSANRRTSRARTWTRLEFLVSLHERLKQIWDVFSMRQGVRGPRYKPDEIPLRARSRILLLYGEVISGRLNTSGFGSTHDHGPQFFDEMHQALRLA